jgi:hypothetical protein
MEIDHSAAVIYQFAVAATQSSPTEETGAVPVTPGPVDEGKELDRGFLRAARKDLTEDEAASPAGVRWLQYEAERLDKDCATNRAEFRELRITHESLQSRCHEACIQIEQLKGA